MFRNAFAIMYWRFSELIKTGRRSGYVEISISNEGDMAYKPDIYGAVIVVRRYFTTTGTGQYKIKSETGKYKPQQQ